MWRRTRETRGTLWVAGAVAVAVVCGGWAGYSCIGTHQNVTLSAASFCSVRWRRRRSIDPGRCWFVKWGGGGARKPENIWGAQP